MLIGNEKLGEGYWYNVYKLSEKRVIKVEKSFYQKLSHVYSLKKKQPVLFLKALINFLVERPKILEIYKHIPNYVDLQLLANPSFHRGLTYEQDKITALEDVFAQGDLNTQKKLVDQYIDHIILCMQYGFFETKFNFLENNGLSADKKVVLYDFNEVTLDKEVAKELIDIQRWRYAYSVRVLPKEIRIYFTQSIEERITADVLESNWCTAIL